jgi:hypothetical protein
MMFNLNLALCGKDLEEGHLFNLCPCPRSLVVAVVFFHSLYQPFISASPLPLTTPCLMPVPLHPQHQGQLRRCLPAGLALA